MNIRQKRIRFVEALESGKYKQIYLQLKIKNPDGPSECFCAVGLAYELLGRDDAVWHGDAYPIVSKEYVLQSVELVKMNDKQRLTFKQIAAELRKEWGI